MAEIATEPDRKEALMETAEAHVWRMEAELKQWASRMDRLLAKADATGARAKTDYRKRLDDLKEKYGAAEEKLAELKAAGGGEWEAFKGGVEDAWSELAAAFTRLAN